MGRTERTGGHPYPANVTWSDLATYSEYSFACREEPGARRDVSPPVQREWYVPERQVLIIDTYPIPDLSGVLSIAVWR